MDLRGLADAVAPLVPAADSALSVPRDKNAIRPSGIGKKNWLFIGHPDAGQHSAILYSLTVS